MLFTAIKILIITTASLFVIIAGAYFTHQISMPILFNSDSIYLASLYQDLFVKQGHLSEWQLTPAPYFFPDMIAFFALKSLIPDTYYTFYWYASFQIIAVYLLASRLLLKFSSKTYHLAFFSLIYLSTIFFLTTRNIHPYIYPLFSAYHFGAIVIGLIFLIAIITAIGAGSSEKSIRPYVLATVCTILGSASDLLFVLWFIVPTLLITVVLRITRSKVNGSSLPTLAIFMSCLGGIIIGLTAKQLIAGRTASRYLLTEQGMLLSQLKIVLLDFIELSQKSPFAALLLGLFYLFLVTEVIFLLTREFDFKKDRLSVDIDIFYFLLLFVIISSLSTVFVVALNGVLVSDDGIKSRYFMNVYWFPVLFSWLVYIKFSTNQVQKLFNFSWLGLSGLMILLSIPLQPIYREYYPPMVKCIDQAVSAFKESSGQVPKVGIGNYWHAKFITEFSRQNLKVVQVNPDLSIFHWINNSDWYQEAYDFAVISQFDDPTSKSGHILSQSKIEKINGKPKDYVICENVQDPINSKEVRILFYEPGELRTEFFQKIGDVYTWHACELPSQVGTISDNCSLTKTLDAESGFLTFGPYERLPTGRFAVSITYTSSVDEEVPIGFWDVMLNLSDHESEQLLQEPLLGTGNQTVTVSGDFEIHEGLSQKPFEIRTYVNAQAVVSVYEITLQKIG
jgi:hypothetical protein